MAESIIREKSRNLDGFLVIDKPKGPTSHQIDHWVRQITGIEKVGHIGTLDPNASGVLVMALGKAVKLIDVAHEYPKEYVAVMRIYGDFTEPEIRKVLGEYVGDIYQIPPMRSAVARALRIRRIFDLNLIEMRNRLVFFRVKCESGTYIRTLCTDIGYTMGPGAQMAELRRTATGPFNEGMIHTLQDLSDASYLEENGDPETLRNMIIPMIDLFRENPKIVVKKSTLQNIAHGSDLFPGGIKAILGRPMKGDRVAVVTEENDLVGTGKMLVSYESIRDLKVVDLDRILIENPDQKERRPERNISVPHVKAGRNSAGKQPFRGGKEKRSGRGDFRGGKSRKERN